MSKFAEKITSNHIPNVEDWNGHLIESHKNASSQTPEAFDTHRTTSFDGILALFRKVVALEPLKAKFEDKKIIKILCRLL